MGSLHASGRAFIGLCCARKAFLAHLAVFIYVCAARQSPIASLNLLAPPLLLLLLLLNQLPGDLVRHDCRHRQWPSRRARIVRHDAWHRPRMAPPMHRPGSGPNWPMGAPIVAGDSSSNSIYFSSLTLFTHHERDRDRLWRAQESAPNWGPVPPLGLRNTHTWS